jgi:hypothetical protein
MLVSSGIYALATRTREAEGLGLASLGLGLAPGSTLPRRCAFATVSVCRRGTPKAPLAKLTCVRE